MSDIRIAVMEGDYDNEDAYNRLLGYIGQKSYLGGYGFCFAPGFPIIEQFRLSEACSSQASPRKIWHFIITFQKAWSHSCLLEIAVQAAVLFSQDYQVLFGLDTGGNGNPHLHFGVNAFSYHPDTAPLFEDRMAGYLACIQKMLSRQSPNMTVTLYFQRRDKNV